MDMKIFVTVLIVTYLLPLVLWTTGAVLIDLGRGGLRGWLLALGWLSLIAGVLAFGQSLGASAIVITCLCFLIWGWWIQQKPSHDRDWDPNFARLPTCEIKNGFLLVRNCRNTQYRSLEDFDARYENRTYCLDQLSGVDMAFLFWGSKWISHPMIIFDFDGETLCVSIEVRYRRGQKYSVLKGLYRQYEMMYVVSDERDAILRRTRHSTNQECYLYRLQMNHEDRIQFLTEYVEATNQLAEKPRWYNVVTDNCTTSIAMQRKRQVFWDWRMFINGSLDELMYERKHLVQSLEFAELKKQSLINQRANNASHENFSREIRHGLPGFESTELRDVETE